MVTRKEQLDRLDDHQLGIQWNMRDPPKGNSLIRYDKTAQFPFASLMASGNFPPMHQRSHLPGVDEDPVQVFDRLGIVVSLGTGTGNASK